MIEAAIFDMDGLLIDSEPFWRKSHIAALAKYGVTITEDDVRKMAGRRTDEVVRHWRHTYALLSHISNELLEADIVTRVIKHIRAEGKLLPGVKNAIEMIKTHHIPIAVASSSAPEIIDVVLHKLHLHKEMKLIYSAKHERFGKPHPGVFLTTAAKLIVPSKTCVVFEDSLNGIRAAKSAGMKCVAVPEPVNFHRPEFHNEADLVLPSLHQLRWSHLVGLF